MGKNKDLPDTQFLSPSCATIQLTIVNWIVAGRGLKFLLTGEKWLYKPGRLGSFRAPVGTRFRLNNEPFPVMKVLSSLASAKRRHADCQVVKRKGTVYVICKSNPKFKARQGATPGTRLSKKGL